MIARGLLSVLFAVLIFAPVVHARGGGAGGEGGGDRPGAHFPDGGDGFGVNRGDDGILQTIFDSDRHRVPAKHEILNGLRSGQCGDLYLSLKQARRSCPIDTPAIPAPGHVGAFTCECTRPGPEGPSNPGGS